MIEKYKYIAQSHVLFILLLNNELLKRTRWKTGRSKSILGIEELKTERINGFHPDMVSRRHCYSTSLLVIQYYLTISSRVILLGTQ